MKVTPKNSDVRKTLVHPTAGGFRAEGSADWPNDTYTFRRIQDGDITAEQPEQQFAQKPRRTKSTEGE